MEGRSFSDESYRYGFNGKENDADFGNRQLIQDYGFRLYNPSIAKFLSVDPLTASYPWYTPYQFAGNKPIWASDLDGLEEKEETTDEAFIEPTVVLVTEKAVERSIVVEAITFLSRYSPLALIFLQGDESKKDPIHVDGMTGPSQKGIDLEEHFRKIQENARGILASIDDDRAEMHRLLEKKLYLEERLSEEEEARLSRLIRELGYEEVLGYIQAQEVTGGKDDALLDLKEINKELTGITQKMMDALNEIDEIKGSTEIKDLSEGEKRLINVCLDEYNRLVDQHNVRSKALREDHNKDNEDLPKKKNIE